MAAKDKAKEDENIAAVHARCEELGIDPGKKGVATLLENIEMVEAALANMPAKPVKKVMRPEHVNERAAQMKKSEQYKAEKKVGVSISPMYSNEFGNTMPISLNGVRIYIPCDGNTYNVPESFAMEIRRRIYAVDTKAKRRKRMASVQDNSEKSPGEIRLFR